MSLNPEDGSFSLSNPLKTVMTINQEGTEIDCSDNVSLHVTSLRASNLWAIEENQIKFNGVPQWKLVHDEIFRIGQHAEGWNMPDAITQCGAMHMLGGYCTTSNENLVKVFNNLPSHRRIRVQANFHFIDSWGGDTAFLKVTSGEDMGDLQYAWTDSYDYVSSRNAVNVCGRDVGDGKFNTFIDFEMAHTHSQIKLMFGSSLEQKACAASYGVSMVRIQVL